MPECPSLGPILSNMVNELLRNRHATIPSSGNAHIGRKFLEARKSLPRPLLPSVPGRGTSYANEVARYAGRNNQTERNHLMKKIIISLACCALVAPLAFAKEPQKKRAW